MNMSPANMAYMQNAIPNKRLAKDMEGEHTTRTILYKQTVLNQTETQDPGIHIIN